MHMKQRMFGGGHGSAVLLAVLLGTRAFAQVADGNLVGTVYDTTGAAIANAHVEVLNLATGVTTAGDADAAGQYRINNLLVGGYTLTASANGFQAASLSPVAVELSKTTTANVTLETGTVAFTVEVVGTPILIDTTTAQIENIYPTRMASDLAIAANLNGGYLNLSLLGAGAASSGGVGGGTGPSFAGQRPRTNNFTIEGTDNNLKDVTGPIVTLPNDAVAEFTVLQNQFSAEYGHSSGGQFNAVMRSGSNALHGRLYEYFQNRNLNALDHAFLNQGITSNPRYDENVVGGYLGGPIKKNKLFYFTNFDYNPMGLATTSPNPKFAPTAAGYAQLASMPGVSQTNLSVLQKYAGAAAQATPGLTTNVQGVDIPLGNVAVLAPNYANYYRGLGSTDYNISDRDQLRGRFVTNRTDAIDTGAQLPSFYGTRPERAYLLALSEIHTFTPTLTNEIRVAYNRYNRQTLPSSQVFPGMNVFPNIVIRNDLGLQFGPNPNSPQATTQNTYQLVDNVTWIKGRHDLKFGFDGRDLISSIDFIPGVRGDYQYNTLDRYLTDLAPDYQAIRSSGSKPYFGNTQQFYLYLNDNWKATRRLTLNLGLRWEYNGVSKSMKEQALNSIADVPGVITFRAPKAQLTNFAPRIGFAYSPGNGGSTVIRGGFGLAYDQIFDNIGNNVRPPQAQSTAYVYGSDAPNFLAGGGIPTSDHGDTLTQDDARFLTSGYVPNQQLPYAVNWNFGVQHVFAKDYVVDIRYVGTRGVHLLLQSQLNRVATVTADHNLPTYLARPSQDALDALPLTLNMLKSEYNQNGNPLAQYGFSYYPITAYKPQGNSIYHGLQIDVTKRLSHNLTFKTGYTWSHAMDDSTMEVNLTTLAPRRPQDFNNIRNEWATSLLDRRQRLTFTWTYDTPWFGSSRNWWLHNVVGNYTFTGVYTAESPQYVTPQSSTDSNLNGDSVSDRAIVNPNGVVGTGSDVKALKNSAGQTVAYLANDPTAQYIRAGQGAYANSGRNLLPTYGINNFDVSIIKNFNVGERYRVEVRADLYNALNHSQFTPGQINNVLPTRHDGVNFYLVPGNPYFGQFNQVYPSNSRRMQLVAKINF